MIGETIRRARLARRQSLADVAEQAGISVATLSRIENDKQTLDLALFLTLARVLEMPPSDLLGAMQSAGGAGDLTDRDEDVAARISALGPAERTELWRELATTRLRIRGRDRRSLNQTMDELIAHVDLVKKEIEQVRAQLRRK